MTRGKPVVACEYIESPTDICDPPVSLEFALAFDIGHEKAALEAIKRAYDDMRAQVESILTLG